MFVSLIHADVGLLLSNERRLPTGDTQPKPSILNCFGTLLDIGTRTVLPVAGSSESVLPKFAECFGGHGEYVEKPEDIRPALERAMQQVKAGKPALVCVVTDWRARATTTAFTRYST